MRIRPQAPFTTLADLNIAFSAAKTKVATDARPPHDHCRAIAGLLFHAATAIAKFPTSRSIVATATRLRQERLRGAAVPQVDQGATFEQRGLSGGKLSSFRTW